MKLYEIRNKKNICSWTEKIIFVFHKKCFKQQKIIFKRKVNIFKFKLNFKFKFSIIEKYKKRKWRILENNYCFICLFFNLNFKRRKNKKIKRFLMKKKSIWMKERLKWKWKIGTRKRGKRRKIKGITSPSYKKWVKFSFGECIPTDSNE